MAETSQLASKRARLHSLLRVRPRVLIVGILGGGTMVVFPAASALAVIYVAVTLAALGVMAWTGMIALASAAAAALVVPVVTVTAIFAVIAVVHLLKKLVFPPCAGGVTAKQQSSADGGSEESNVLQQSLDDWETDGGPAALPRRRVVKRRVGRFDRHRVPLQLAVASERRTHVEPR